MKNVNKGRLANHPGVNIREEIEKKAKNETGSSDTIRLYFEKIRKCPLLSGKEEKRVALLVEQGDTRARATMIESNLRLVVNIAKRYMNRGLPLQDLIEEGNIGLIRSVERFKVSKGCKFSTYATYWIRQAVERAIMNQAAVVRLPIHVSNDLSKMYKISGEFHREFKREPTEEEIANKMGVRGRYIKKLQRINRKISSVDAPLAEGTEETLLDRLADDNVIQPLEYMSGGHRRDKVRAWLATLEDNERDILSLRYGLSGDPQTLEKIGRRFGVTRERIRQIETRALRKLRQLGEEQNIDSLQAI